MQEKNHGGCTVMGFTRLKQYDCSAIVAMIGCPGD